MTGGIMVDGPRRRKIMVKAILRMFPKRANRFTVKNVIWWLEKLKVDGDSLAVPALCSEGVDLTDPLVFNDNIVRVWELKRELIMGCLAQDVAARWLGGPPTAIKRYAGSFLQLLMDRIMMDIDCYGTRNFVRINREWRAELKADKVYLYPLPTTLQDLETIKPSPPSEVVSAEWAR